MSELPDEADEPAKSPTRVAHDHWPGSAAEQRIIRSRVRLILEKRDAEWRSIIGRMSEKIRL